MAILPAKSGTATLSWPLNNISLVAEWTFRENPKSSFSEIDIKIPSISDVKVLNAIQEWDPAECILRMTEAVHLEQRIEPQTLKFRKPWIKWLLESVRRTGYLRSELRPTFVLILSNCSGHILMNDVFRKRLFGCDHVDEIFDELQPCQFVPEVIVSSSLGVASSLENIFDSSICGVLFKSPVTESDSGKYHEILQDRLSMPLVASGNLKRKRVAFVSGGINFEYRRDLFSAAAGLGIDLVVLDKPGHPLQNPQFSHFVEGFVPVDLSLDSDLPMRLVAALKGYPHQIDGVIALSDRFLCQTAIAAKQLSLLATPVELLQKSVDKSLTRELIPIPGQHKVVAFKDQESAIPNVEELEYPVILKPSEGSGSRGVFLARSVEELLAARRKICALGWNGIIEPYIDGPEVDVNIVLLEGEAIFFGDI